MDASTLDRLEPWLSDHVDASRPVRAELIAAGRSNLTYKLTDASDRSWALRRPPEGPKVQSAHDVLREYRVISALEKGSNVPVARTFGADAGALLGSPFFVMEFVEGSILRGRKQSSKLTEACRAAAARSLIEAFDAIHKTDFDASGLADLAPSAGYLSRQLERWFGSFNRVRTRDVPAVESLYNWLVANLPADSATTLVHGDFRLDNAVIDDGGTVLAILDWELATLGDPLTDLAVAWAYWAGDGDEAVGPTALPGFPDRDGFLATYVELSGRDIGDLKWHKVFAYWKLACVAEQLAARYGGGGGGGDRSRTDNLLEHTLRFAQRASDLVEG
jgi:aminoglycoside phosphotransferase (APT) family kinase protein